MAMSTSTDASGSPLKPVSLDFELPVIDWCPPNFPEQTLAEVYACNAEHRRHVVYDDAYFAARLAQQVTVPFVWP
jgi:hypothetical protein